MARERMSGVDTAWLRMDSAGNLMMIVGVWVFDAPIPIESLRTRLSERLLRFDRFRQKVDVDATGYWWVDDDHFDLDHHLTSTRLPAPGTDEQLKQLVGRLASEPLDPARPLWQFHLVHGYDGTSAMIARIHHCIADGIALIGVTMSLTDQPPPGARPADTDDEPRHEDDHGLNTAWDTLIQPVTRQAVKAAEVAGAALGHSIELMSDAQGRALMRAAGTRLVRDAAKIALMADDSPTRLKGRPRGTKVVAWNDPLPLDEVKAVCKVLGVSVNDVLLSCVAGAIHRYLEADGEHTRGEEIRAMVPVNLRPPGGPMSLGNRFGLVPLTLPVGISNPIERVFEVRRRMDDLKGGYQGPLAYALLSAIGFAPKPVQQMVLGYLAQKGTAVMTNVPGPTRAIEIAGIPLRRTMFWVPQSGDIGVGVSIVSYDGGVQFGLITDAAICAEPQRIIREFAPEFERLLLTLCMLPHELVHRGVTDPRELERRLLTLGPDAAPGGRRARAPRRARTATTRSASRAG
ncbi:MAG TPA: wax ester/triacylglycerol synthase family O-acyltransferase [Quisquiliibacterium sp.]|nr:wax ester/triacylglycerol synthase family O-acyltransferase [Quisquiliibacterium sp.]HQN14499.1 wax ester/triacylglycerol synthase family O-acyltransferase [Quisquiliibacterium sp.]